jgi:multidrug transporter EmrE-like cation transporter
MFKKTTGENWLIVGLGNPGREYEKTRHNAGFRALDILADQMGVKVDKLKYQGLYTQANYNGGKVFLLIFGIVGAYTVLNSMGNIFSIRAAAVPGMQSSVQFPLLNALIMILTSILGRIVFKEKIGKRDLISIALLVGGILLFMLSFVIYGR